MTVALLLTFSLPVFADAIPMEPQNCPAGSSGQSSHAGTWCEASTCNDAAPCPDGQTCREIGLCVNVQEWNCGGMRPETAEECTFTVNEAVGRCRTDADCAGPATCIVTTRCAGGEGCMGCSSTGSISGFAAIGGFVLLGVLAPRRRRA